MRQLSNMSLVIIFGLTFSLSLFAYAENEIITIEGTRIRGNQELPTVLYVVPWKPPEIQQLDTPKSAFTSQRPLKKIERSSFNRLVSYHQRFQTLNVIDVEE